MTDANCAQLNVCGPGWREWVALAVLTVPVFMTAIDISVLFLALPSIAADLAPSATQQLWTLHIGDLLSAGLVLTAGMFADRLGPRRLLVLGMVAYAAFSLIAAMAPNAETLILARGLIGIAAVTVTPATMVLLRQMFPTPRQFAMAISVFMAAFAGGRAFGPPFAGLILEYFPWGAIFLANLPAAAFVIATAWLLPGIKGTGAGRIDVLSIGLSLSAVILIVLGLQEIAAKGIALPYLAAIALGAFLTLTFVRRQLRLTEPLFDMNLFRNPGFSCALAVLLVFIMAISATYLQFAQYLQTVLGLSALDAGVILVFPAVFQVAATALAPRLLHWMTPATTIMTGATIAIGGAMLVVIGTTAPLAVAPAVMIVGDCIMAIGSGPTIALGSSIIIASAPLGRTGSATGMQEVAGGLGNGLGLAIGGSIAVILYKAGFTGALPDGLSAIDARQASESMGRAIAIADRLGDGVGEALRETARNAFASATRAVYAYAMLLMAACIILTWSGLRGVRIEDEPATDAGRQ